MVDDSLDWMVGYAYSDGFGVTIVLGSAATGPSHWVVECQRTCASYCIWSVSNPDEFERLGIIV